ncbi:MAG: adenylosuccinate synthase [Halobacteriovoraceae bacterium]|nr:adenylosuccinate synthase [Halobacteriovoraceae bacterium]|tara:strand:- start:1848 stop:3119 length:1272 start_codon:yes stop_codon:yes gene_type:complete
MTSLAIIGAQWGDEGKGKITDLLGQKADYVVRFQGGNNAGHTIIVGEKKIVLHQIPSGILHKNCTSVIAHGVVFEPEAFMEELKKVSEDIEVNPDRLKISLHATIITRYHKLLDSIREGATNNKIGTTGKGIGPAYEDKIGRRAIKMKDLFNKEVLTRKLKIALEEKEHLFKNLYKVDYPTIEEEVERLFEFGQVLFPYVDDTFSLIDKATQSGKKVLFEGAQGILLDIDYGSYPYVTSSSTGAAGIYTGAGVTNGVVGEKLGIVKAYTTRVGEGPMPTEIAEEIGDRIQQIGAEFGATTGRRRRCGWLDLPILKYSVKASSLTSIALTKVDVLSGLEELKVCYAYEVDGREYDCAYPGLDLSQAKPLYKSLKPFKDDFQAKGKYAEELEDYIKLIEENLGIPVGIVAFGPERSQIHFRKDYF